jgi:MFS family permease
LGGLDWQVVIYVTSGITVAGGLVTEFALQQGPYAFPKATFDPRQIGRVFANRGVRLASFGYVGHMWELFALYAWYAVFFRDMLTNQGIRTGSIPAFATFGLFLAGGVGCWLGGVLADRWGRARTTILMMAISGTCALVIGLFFNASPWLVVGISLVWGFAVVADSAQFSTLVTETADQTYVGTALTLQLAAGFTITVATIWLIPSIESFLGWRWTFAFLAPGPIFGILSMLRLRHSPDRSTATESRQPVQSA